MKVKVRILFQALIRGVVLVGRWVVVVTPTTVLKIKKIEKVFNPYSGTKKLKIEKKKKKLKFFWYIYLRYKITP